MRHVYLDHQTTTPVLPEVLDAMLPFFTEVFGSPGSLHRHGLRVRDALAKARSQAAGLIHAQSADDIIFTSSGTESANLAIKGTAYASQRRGNHIVTSVIEHPAVSNSLEFLERQGFTSTKVKVNAEGFIDPEQVRAALTDKTILICVHHAHHDLGTVQPILEIGAIAAERGIPLFVDATASGGWLPIDAGIPGIGLMSLAPHRFYGPKGVGILCRHRQARVTSLIHGGAQEGERRAGTENVPAIVGAGVAAELAARELAERMAHVGRLQKRLWEGLKEKIPHLKLNGPEPGPRRLPTHLNVSIGFVEGEGVMLLADLQGIAIASGAMCVSKSLKVSPALVAIGVEHSLAQGAVIFSLGKQNTEEEIDYVIDTLPRLVSKLRGMSPLWQEFQKP